MLPGRTPADEEARRETRASAEAEERVVNTIWLGSFVRVLLEEE